MQNIYILLLTSIGFIEITNANEDRCREVIQQVVAGNLNGKPFLMLERSRESLKVEGWSDYIKGEVHAGTSTNGYRLVAADASHAKVLIHLDPTARDYFPKPENFIPKGYKGDFQWMPDPLDKFIYRTKLYDAKLLSYNEANQQFAIRNLPSHQGTAYIEFKFTNASLYVGASSIGDPWEAKVIHFRCLLNRIAATTLIAEMPEIRTAIFKIDLKDANQSKRMSDLLLNLETYSNFEYINQRY